MALQVSVIREVEGLHALEDAWQKLANDANGGSTFRAPRWTLAWWHSYHRQLGAGLYVLAALDDGVLVGLLPMYRRDARRSPGAKVTELRLLGDAGPRPPSLDMLVAPDRTERVGVAFANALSANDSEWDVLDLQPLEEPSPARAFLAQRLSALGRHVESIEAGGGRRLQLGLVEDSGPLSGKGRHRIYEGEAAGTRKGLATLRRLSRLEWASREEASPLVDREATHLLEDFVIPQSVEKKAHISRLDDVDGEAIACCLVVDEGDRAIMLALAVDPEHADSAARLIEVEAGRAKERGAKTLDIAIGAYDYDLPALPSSRIRAIRLRAYGSSASAALARTYGAVRRSVEVAKDAPGAAAAGARAAWSKIRTAAAHVAGYERMHLYRGELWTRNSPVPEGLSMRMFGEEDFNALDDAERNAIIECLELDEVQARVAWQRGDLSVYAILSERPAGIAWCARSDVDVPEIERKVRIGVGEAYIHDVFVAPQARGRSVAPAMLEFFAAELRQRDVYRSWALIGTDNVASTRAFEKAAYTAVCDVVFARMAVADRVFVRPPDPEAKKLLGL